MQRGGWLLSVAVLALLIPGCVTPGKHLQVFVPLNQSLEPVFFHYVLVRTSHGNDDMYVAHEANQTLNASSYYRLYERFGNGWYRLDVNTSSEKGEGLASLGSLGFGDVGGGNLDPDADPRFLYMVWDGERVSIVPCTDECPSTKNLTRMHAENDW